MAQVEGPACDAVVSTSSSPSSPLEGPWDTCPGAPGLTAAPHQIAGHLFSHGKVGSLVCDSGFFYKPLQAGPREERERGLYEAVKASAEADSDEEEATTTSSSLLRDLSGFVPAFYGVLEMGGITYMKLEDVCKRYDRPCLIDVKIGYQTWCPRETEEHISRRIVKDRQTTTKTLGFKVCGMQVYDPQADTYWRATKSWCKALDAASVQRALARFCDHPSQNVGSSDICLGLVSRLQDLERWSEAQRLYHFYSASVLVVYEGSASAPEDLNLNLKLIDFAHAHPAITRDDNFVSGLASLRATVQGVIGEG
ncbi:inositol polyphosphate multikinase [Chloropicon roscoffensis]|uniref:Inositol polyphosphate multikinase n=1 Tax=Chloropicon roscoffensis TaxID=1461544 RepID=A0AAX4P0L5_9CHLO